MGGGTCAVTLAPRPGIAADGYHLLLTSCNQAFIDVLLMGHGEVGMCFCCWTDVKQNLIVLLNVVEFIARIEPESTYANVEVVLEEIK